MKSVRSFLDLLIDRLVPHPGRPAWALPGAGRVPGASPLLLFSAGDSGSDDREEVEVTRRRQTSGGGPRERAEAPSRRREGESSAPAGRADYGGSYGGSGAGGTGIPPEVVGGLLKGIFSLPLPVLAIGAVLLCCVGAAVIFVLPQFAPSTDTGVLPPDTQVPAVAVPSSTPRPASGAGSVATTTPGSPTRAPSAPVASGTGTWTIMLYQDATDKVLDEDIFVDLNEAERAGSTDRIRIVSQIDRYRSRQNAAQWATAKRFYVTRDPDLHTVKSQQLADLGQVNMADPNTLIDFATWAIKTYPADKYVLILSDHGMGWPGGWTDPAVSASGNRQVPLKASLGNMIFLDDLDKAFGTIRSRSGVDKFELIGLDACLMSQMEVLDALAPHARYAVASEETEPALGWAYTSFLDKLQANPGMSGGDLAKAIVQTYIQDDQRIVDDQARAEFAGRGTSMGGLFGASAAPSAAQVARELGQDVTLTAIDLQTYPALLSSFNNLAFALQQADPRVLSQARSYAQSYTSIFGQSVPPSYIDLGHWIQLVARSNQNRAVADAAQQFMTSLGKTVIAEKHGPGKPGSTGISIYFPTSKLYNNAVAGPESYTAIANRFAADSLWDDLLAFFYTGRRFTQAPGAAAVPQRGTTITAPAAGGIRVSPITLSSRTAAPGRPVVLSMDVTGKNVGHIRLFIGFYDKTSNSINVTDEDYLQSSQTRELNGVYYPAWPESGKFTVKFEWDPIVFAIDDGKHSVVARFAPESYGRSQAEATYTVDGTYTFADGTPSRPARLYFRDNLLRQVFGFTGDGFTGAPWEVTTKPGDTFTVLEKWIDLDASGKPTPTATQDGGTVTFGDQPLKWKDLDAAAGDYVVGFIVEDLDGNQQQVFQRITVQ